MLQCTEWTKSCLICDQRAFNAVVSSWEKLGSDESSWCHVSTVNGWKPQGLDLCFSPMVHMYVCACCFLMLSVFWVMREDGLLRCFSHSRAPPVSGLHPYLSLWKHSPYIRHLLYAKYHELIHLRCGWHISFSPAVVLPCCTLHDLMYVWAGLFNLQCVQWGWVDAYRGSKTACAFKYVERFPLPLPTKL